MVHCIIPNRCITKIIMLMKGKIWTKFPVLPDMTTPFTMRCRQLTSIAAMCQPSRECMRTLRQDVKRIMCATMDAKDTRAPRFCVQTARFSIRRNLHATGGTTLIAHKHKISISKFSERKKYECVLQLWLWRKKIILFLFLFNDPVWTLTQNTIRTFPKRRQKIYITENLWSMLDSFVG